MQRIRVSLGLAFLAMPLLADSNFVGKWELNTSRSKNIGMMAQMKLTATVEQTASELIIRNVSVFDGREQTSELKFDLTGKPVPNKSPMEATAETVSKWEGERLVTTWTSEGSVAGSKSVRTETRYLSDGGRTLIMESQRGQSPAMVMVYDRK
ncbi:MAG TPA: hypothetical protein VFB14_29100 [Bryobacteraceae bacterium]|jgi:hypothetical protein|nr:hypothetical protein [Bryobacteraceae bacterium]